MNKEGKYKDGISMRDFKRIPEISHYNSNYYIGVDSDLLYAKSDDDNTTEWFVAYGDQFIYFGYSLVSENDKLIRTEHRCT